TEVKGWLTTHKLTKLIEIWRGGGAAPSNQPATGTKYLTKWETANGKASSSTANQYAELNAEDASALYQPVCLFKDEEFSWNFRHAARASTNEQATFYI